jgi:hypothetical protein
MAGRLRGFSTAGVTPDSFTGSEAALVAPVGSGTVSDEIRGAFRQLHSAGTFVLPNPWDVPSARLLEHLGFPALATTSSGFAASLGRADQHVTRDELVAHVTALTAAVQTPVSVDVERGHAHDPTGVAETVRMLADAGASGVSIEDYDSGTAGAEYVGGGQQARQHRRVRDFGGGDEGAVGERDEQRLGLGVVGSDELPVLAGALPAGRLRG